MVVGIAALLTGEKSISKVSDNDMSVWVCIGCSQVGFMTLTSY
jgi:hypothetical protein